MINPVKSFLTHGPLNALFSSQRFHRPKPPWTPYEAYTLSIVFFIASYWSMKFVVSLSKFLLSKCS